MHTGVRILLACSALAGCADVVGGDDEPTGTYELMSVNGAPLPFTYYSTPPPSPIYTNRTVAGSVTLKPNDTFVIRLTAHLAKDEVVYNVITDSAGGNFTLAGDAVTYTYTWPSGGTRTGTLEGRTLTMDAEGNIYSFRK